MPLLESFRQDLRHALRALRRSPTFTAAAVLSLALGIGANTLIFTFLNAVFLKALPVAEPEGLVALYSFDTAKGELLPSSYLNLEDLRRERRAFAGLAAYRNLSVALTGDGEPAQLQGEIVAGNYFDLLGIRPAAGRFFLLDEDRTPGTHPVAVLSHALWQSRYGADPKLVGRTIRLNNIAFNVVGIAPPQFKGLSVLDAPPALWVPMAMYREVLRGPQAQAIEKRGSLAFEAVARLAPGVGPEQARTLLATVAGRLEREYPDANEGLGLAAVPLQEATLPPDRRGQIVLSGGLLAAMVALLLLIAGANVANLMLARALARGGEIAVRLSLGAGRGRLIRQLLTEGALIGLLGGAAGLLVALWGRKVLWALKPPFFPDSLDLGLDLRVLGFTLAVSLATGLLFSLAPVVQSFRLDLSSTLIRQERVAGGSGSLFRGLLVAGQVALSVVMLTGAALFLRSLQAVERIDPGFETERLFVIPMDLGAQGYPPPRIQELYQRAVERVAALPGVRSSAVASRFLLVPAGLRNSVTAEGRAAAQPGDEVTAGIVTVGPGYFDTVGMPMRAGRPLGAADREGALPAIVINETLARRLWPGEPAVGRRLRLGDGEELLTVVGVVADARTSGLREPPSPQAYRPVQQSFSPMMMLHVRTAGDPGPLLAPVRREIQALDPGLPLLEARTITQLRNHSIWAPRMGAGLLTVFGLLALALSALGIYGVVAYSIGQRRREIGVRMAMGAGRREILGLVLRQGLRPVVLGAAVGIAAALAAARAVASLLVDVAASDPLALAGAVAVLVLVAVAAVYAPARRASGLDPNRALRQT